MVAGQSYPVSVTMKNNGSTTWNALNLIRLQGIGDETGDAAKFGAVRIDIPAGTNVLYGTKYTFSYTMTAPAVPGYYTPKYRMSRNGYKWFGATAIKTIQVVSPTAVVKNTPAPTITKPVSGTPPKAQFTSNVTKGMSPLFVQFTDQSTGTAPLTYHWDFSDGEGKLPENSQKSPVWRFWEDVGTTYTVTLTVTNAYGSDTIVKQNYITLGTASSAAPVAAFTSSVQSGAAPLTVQFTDQSTGAPLTYAWDFNNDKKTESTVKTPSFTYTTAGNYTVNLTVSNAKGKDSEVKTAYIKVSATGTKPTPTPTPTPKPTVTPARLPAAQFTASATSGQAPLKVQFTDQSVSTGTSTYAWDVNNDGTTDYTTKSPSHTYTAAGTFTVKLTVTNASGSDSEVKTGYITASSSPVVTGTGEYGAAANPTGNPIGGGAGYTRIISQTDSRVKYVVSTAAELIAALRSAKSGEVVFIKGSAVIDMTANPAITIPAGVTLASDRGLNGSLGALIKRSRNVNGGWGEQIFIAGGNNVRLTGVRLEGEMYPQDYGNKAGETSEQQYLVGIYAKERTGYEVDNCELRGFAWSAVVSDNCVQSYVHHNYIHHNQARGEGYGVALYGGTSIIEANIFDYNRHSITGTGYAGEGYEARYNIVKGNGNAIGGHHFDVHQDERGGSFAGNLYKIHHNTFQDGNGKLASIAIRQRPVTGMYIDHNVFETVSDATDGGVPIWERDSSQNMFATNNKWMGKLYPTNSGIVLDR